MTPSELAAELAARLAAVLPPGFGARSDGGVVDVDTPDGFGCRGLARSLSIRARLEPQDLADAAWNVFSMAQDVVSETATEPWPSAVGPGRDLAEARGSRGSTARDQPALILSDARADSQPSVA